MGVHSSERKANIATGVKAAWAAGKYIGTKNIGPPRHEPGYRQTDEVRARISATLKEAHRTGRLSANQERFSFKKGDGFASGLRLAQIEHEVAEAEKLVAEGYEVFSPTVVCDRIVVRDGIVYFFEFKRNGQLLRPAQQKVQQLVPDRYLVRYAGEMTVKVKRKK